MSCLLYLLYVSLVIAHALICQGSHRSHDASGCLAILVDTAFVQPKGAARLADLASKVLAMQASGKLRMEVRA